MSKTPESTFQFINFTVLESRIKFNKPGELNIIIDIVPSATILSSLNQFHLQLDTNIKDEQELVEIFVRAYGLFEFPEDADLEEYKKSFFISNAPAIMFPYLRAYIAALASLSGVGEVMLPTLNMSNLAEILLENIEIK